MNTHIHRHAAVKWGRKFIPTILTSMGKVKGKAIPEQHGPEDSRRLRPPYFSTIGT